MLSNVNVVVELERNAVLFEYAGEAEVKVKCPFHSDNSPSCHINTDIKLFKCQTAGCDAKGDFATFLAKVLDTTRTTIIEDLSTRYLITNNKIIEADTIERYHTGIWSHPLFMGELKKRGIDDDLIRKYRIGQYRNRITIPITNEYGSFVNVRRYLPGASGKDKMKNTKGRGEARLFPIEQLKYSTVLICGGELKSILAAKELNKHDIGALCCTAGEGNWDAKFTRDLKGKTLYVCYDVDKEGQAGAKLLLQQLYRVADTVHNVLLPLDIDRFPHGDINDYCAHPLNGKLLPLLDKSEEWEPEQYKKEEKKDPIGVELNEASNAKSANKRIKVTAIASASQEASYSIPKEVLPICNKDQTGLCAVCPVYLEDKNCKFEIPDESEAILEMVSSPKHVQREAIMSGIGIPITCKVCTFEVSQYYNVEDIRISPRLEISNRSVERAMQPAMCIGDQIELNETYEFVGRMHPHPKTQQSTLMISKYKPTKDALQSYIAKDLDKLKVFQPEEWTLDGLSKKLTNLYEDFEANVTRIMQRKELHLSVDLAYFSPLLLKFDEKTIKGWTEILVLGDSSQGKSDTAIGLQKFYGLGEKVECKNATVAGLLGGLQSLSGKWFVTWGVIPTHDQRLVILEELKGAHTEVIAKLTDMRSSGIAEIPKIEKRRTRARTRLLAISNARSDRQLASYNYGVEAVKELIGSLEDVRRFDFCLMVSEKDIDVNLLNRLRREKPKVEHVHTDELNRSLILWVWTRDENQVKFEEGATELILDVAVDLSNTFSESIPLIDKGSTRYKLARLSAALAARTFSTTKDQQHLLVRKCHVQYVADFIRKTYSGAVFGYKEYSEAINSKNKLSDVPVIENCIKSTPFVKDFIEQLLQTNYIELTDIQDWCGWEQTEARTIISLLVRKHALQRVKRFYLKTPPFIELLREMLEGDLPERPDFMKEEF